MTADFQTLQQQFAACIRDPDHAPVPEGCSPDRMRRYHELFYNNFDGILDGTFPRFRATLTADEWTRLIQSFFRDTPQHSPFLADVPARFTDFLAEQACLPLTAGQAELAAFEQACFELRKAEDPEYPAAAFDPEGDLLAGHPVINPECLLFESDYPVHDPDWSPTDPAVQPTFLCLIRNDEGQIRTQVLSAASALLLALIDESPATSGEMIVDQLCRQLDLPIATTRHSALTQLETWRTDRIILGAAHPIPLKPDE